MYVGHSQKCSMADKHCSAKDFITTQEMQSVHLSSSEDLSSSEEEDNEEWVRELRYFHVCY